jgi:hypothetical protein
VSCQPTFEAEVRRKEIQFSSRTRAATDQYKNAQKVRIAFANILKELPTKLLDHPDVKMLADELLVSGHIKATAALQILDDAMDQSRG